MYAWCEDNRNIELKGACLRLASNQVALAAGADVVRASLGGTTLLGRRRRFVWVSSWFTLQTMDEPSSFFLNEGVFSE